MGNVEAHGPGNLAHSFTTLVPLRTSMFLPTVKKAFCRPSAESEKNSTVIIGRLVAQASLRKASIPLSPERRQPGRKKDRLLDATSHLRDGTQRANGESSTIQGRRHRVRPLVDPTPTSVITHQHPKYPEHTRLVGVGCDVIVPRHKSDLSPLFTEHADDVVLHATVHRQHLQEARITNQRYGCIDARAWERETVVGRTRTDGTPFRSNTSIKEMRP